MLIPGRIRARVPEIKDNGPLAIAIAEHLLSKRGISDVRVNRDCASVVIGYDPSVLKTFMPEGQLRGIRIGKPAGTRIAVDGNGHRDCKVTPPLARAWEVMRRYAGLILPTVALVVSRATRLLPIAPVYCLVAAAALPVFKRTALTIRREKRVGVDFLDATALAIMGIQRNLPTCAFMSWLISVGEHIREETARKSQKAIADLLAFHVDAATILVGKRRVKVAVDCLTPGCLVVVNAGDVIPVDGRVVSGCVGVDQMSLTGEAALREKLAGDTVFAGSVAIDGELVIQAAAVGLDTRAGKIVQALRSAPLQETKIEDYAARFADRLVIPTFAASGAVWAMSRSLGRALSMLIVDFGTGVRVAAPTAFLSFMTYAAQRNIVIKGGRAIEKLGNADAVVFDKTGTLTSGEPEIVDVIALGRFTEKGLIRLAAAAEAGLNHPVANALAAKAAQLKVRLPGKVEARLRVGMGVSAQVEGKRIVVGSERLMVESGVDVSEAKQAVCSIETGSGSALYVAVDGRLAGVVTCADRVRPESRMVIDSLRSLGVTRIVVLTGDRREAAREVCEGLGVDEFYAEVFPEDKLRIIRALQKSGHTIAVVGDGINDSLALAHADVAIAPAGATDAAKEAADVLLMEDDLRLILSAFTIARSALGLVRQNFKVVAVPNAGALALAAGGLLGPAGATLVNNGSTVAAALNGLRPLLRRQR